MKSETKVEGPLDISYLGIEFHAAGSHSTLNESALFIPEGEKLFGDSRE